MEGKHMMPDGHMMSDKEMEEMMNGKKMAKKKKKMMSGKSYSKDMVAMAREKMK